MRNSSHQFSINDGGHRIMVRDSWRLDGTWFRMFSTSDFAASAIVTRSVMLSPLAIASTPYTRLYLHLHSFSKAHGMRKQAALQRVVVGHQLSPHELNTFQLMGLDPCADFWVEEN